MTSPRVAPLAAAAAAAAALLAGCTGGGAVTTTSSTSPATVAPLGSGQPATSLQDQYVRVVKQVRSSVVQIRTSSDLGSGIVFDTKGDIVTNDHVVGQAKSFSVQLAKGGAPLSATLVGAYPPDDLAVIRVSKSGGLSPATFANSDKLVVGDIVLAIGNPLGYSSSVTDGIVSATGRTVVEPQRPPSPGGTIADAIQTSAAINPGNSGGALVDLSGQVVGIPTLAAVDPQIGGAAIGIGFAIPSNTVKDIAAQIIAHGHVVNSHRAELGIYGFGVANGSGQPAGVDVQKLVPNGPAAQAGIKVGSIITSVASQSVTSVTDLDKVLAELKPGQKVKVGVITPGGSKSTVTVTLGTLPGTAG
ncbi:MAG: S1C family serine protease [Acidimicrobiales bacterium]